MVGRAWTGLRNLSSRVVAATLNQVIEHLVAALDDVRLQATLNLGNLIVILVAYGAVQGQIKGSNEIVISAFINTLIENKY